MSDQKITPDSIQSTTQEQYQRVCDTFGISPANRPKLVLKDGLSQLSIRLAGIYTHSTDTLTLLESTASNDFVISHELCHAVSARVIGYYGHHGAPFLALLDLVCLNFFSGYNGEVISETVRLSWPRLVPTYWRRREIDAAVHASALVQAELKLTGSMRPSIEEIAARLRLHFSDRVGSNMSLISKWVDRATTQRGQWLSYLLIANFQLLLISAFLAQIPLLRIVGSELTKFFLRASLGALALTMGLQFLQGLSNKVQDLRAFCRRFLGRFRRREK